MMTTIILTYKKNEYNIPNTFVNEMYIETIKKLDKWGTKYSIDKNVIKFDGEDKTIEIFDGFIKISNWNLNNSFDFYIDGAGTFEVKYGEDF